MRRGLVVIGIVLLLIGVALTLLPLTQSTSYTVPHYPNSINLSPNLVGSGSLTISWSGASSSTYIVVLPCSGGVCSGSSTPIVNQSGASGSVTFNIAAGSTVAVTEFGPTGSVAATITVSGISPTQLVGIVLIIVGAIVAIVGFRAKARAPAAGPVVFEESAAPAPAPAPTPPPIAAPRVAPQPSAPAPVEPPSGPQYYTPPPEEVTMPPPARPAANPAQARAARTCGYCGTVNEPWITNCRKCKRALASTSD